MRFSGISAEWRRDQLTLCILPWYPWMCGSSKQRRTSTRMTGARRSWHFAAWLHRSLARIHVRLTSLPLSLPLRLAYARLSPALHCNKPSFSLTKPRARTPATENAVQHYETPLTRTHRQPKPYCPRLAECGDYNAHPRRALVAATCWWRAVLDCTHAPKGARFQTREWNNAENISPYIARPISPHGNQLDSLMLS